MNHTPGAIASLLAAIRVGVLIGFRRSNVLGTESQSHYSRGNPAQYREALQQSKQQGKPPKRLFAAQSRAQKIPVREYLHALSHPSRKLTAFLDGTEPFVNRRAAQQRLPQNIRSGDGVLNSKIDAHPSDGRHLGLWAPPSCTPCEFLASECPSGIRTYDPSVSAPGY